MSVTERSTIGDSSNKFQPSDDILRTAVLERISGDLKLVVVAKAIIDGKRINRRDITLFIFIFSLFSLYYIVFLPSKTVNSDKGHSVLKREAV